MDRLLVLLSICYVGSGFTINHPDGKSGKPGKPLFLTPYIKSGKIEEGRNAAKGKPFFGDVESYSGFLTVNETYNGNMFFWYFPAEEEYSNGKPAPVVIWLQGGPGGSSLFGLLFEHGPLVLNQNFPITKRQYRWSQHHHVIYIDNPVGTGFSFSEKDGYSKNEVEVSNNLYELLIQFFQLFPNLAQNEFFVAGESYAGEYVPAISHKIHTENPTAKLKINLKGLAIGDGVYDGWGHFPHMRTHIDGDLVPLRNYFSSKNSSDIRRNIHEGSWPLVRKNLRDVGINEHGAIRLLNEYFGSWRSTDVRWNIHVGTAGFLAWNANVCGDLISSNEPIAPVIEELLEHYRVIYYNGVNDGIIHHKGTEQFLEGLTWSGSSEYRKAAMIPWKVDNEDAGFVRAACGLTYVLFNDASLTVPADQPRRALEMITKFTRNKPLV